MKKVYILAYSKMNLGDDLFIDMLVNRYKKIQFYSRNMTMDSNAYKQNKNLHFIDYTLDDLLTLDINEFDAFVYIGGSIFMEHAGGIERVQKLKELALRCKALSIPFYYISSNFGPYQTEEYKNTVSEIFEIVTDVCLRDKVSYELFNSIENVRYAPDAVLSYQIDNPIRDSKTIGISVISFKFRESLKKYEEKYYELILNSVINYAKNGYKVKLFSFCEYEGDRETADLILNRLPKEYLKSVEQITYSGNIKDFFTFNIFKN